MVLTPEEGGITLGEGILEIIVSALLVLEEIIDLEEMLLLIHQIIAIDFFYVRFYV